MSLNAYSEETVSADPGYPRLKEFLVNATGLAYYRERDRDLAYRLGRRMARLGIAGCGAYLEAIQQDGEEWQGLVADLAIGETYFFRHQEQFEALRAVVLPELIERNRTARRLRIWSAGCANGAELYSVSILLRGEFEREIGGWQVALLGTDINSEALARARAGRFDEWSLRTMPEDLRRDCFTPAGKCWDILPKYRRDVLFRKHNLATDPAPAHERSLFDFDLILCRNVMIYFSAALSREIVGRLGECLAEGGYLVVGYAELMSENLAMFQAVNCGGATVYRKDGAPVLPVAQARASVPKPVPEPATPAVPPPAVPPDEPWPMPPSGQGEVPAAQPELRIEPAPPREECIGTLRRLTDAARWAEAAALCERLIEEDPLNAKVHFYHSQILGQCGEPGEQERALRRAIYLDRSCVLAHYHLGLMLQAANAATAVRAFTTALRLCGELDGSSVLEEGDGITVSEFRGLVQMHLGTLERGRHG